MARNHGCGATATDPQPLARRHVDPQRQPVRRNLDTANADVARKRRVERRVRRGCGDVGASVALWIPTVQVLVPFCRIQNI